MSSMQLGAVNDTIEAQIKKIKKTLTRIKKK